MLQIQPQKDIVIYFITQQDYKYVPVHSIYNLMHINYMYLLIPYVSGNKFIHIDDYNRDIIQMSNVFF